MKICIVIPVYNEAKEIGNVVSAVRAKGFDVVVIDDGSTDNSCALAQAQGAVVLQNAQRSGKGSSLQRGLDYVLQHDYEGVITMDGDGQHDPADLDHFVQKISVEPNSVVAGSRMENPQGMPPVRWATNRLMSILISAICHQNIPDTQCGYRYIGRAVLERLHLTSHDYEIETEVLIKTSRMGYPILSAPIKTIYSGEESKINPLKDTLRFIIYLFKEMTGSRS